MIVSAGNSSELISLKFSALIKSQIGVIKQSISAPECLAPKK